MFRILHCSMNRCPGIDFYLYWATYTSQTMGARGQVGFDPLFKVRPFVNQLLTVFSEVYSPERDLSFDDTTCAWREWLRFRIYNPAKPTKFGIKLYQVCEVKSGYCIGFDIYTGSTPCTLSDAIGVNEDCTGTTRTVMGLLTRCGLLDKWHHVYMDNYYTSPEFQGVATAQHLRLWYIQKKTENVCQKLWKGTSSLNLPKLFSEGMKGKKCWQSSTTTNETWICWLRFTKRTWQYSINGTGQQMSILWNQLVLWNTLV